MYLVSRFCTWGEFWKLLRPGTAHKSPVVSSFSPTSSHQFGNILAGDSDGEEDDEEGANDEEDVVEEVKIASY